MKKLFLTLLVTLHLISCTTSKCSHLKPPPTQSHRNTILPLKSFVKIQTVVVNEAGGMMPYSSASGFFVSKRRLVTANHFCDTEDIKMEFLKREMYVDVFFILTTFSGEVYQPFVLKVDPKNDLCMMAVAELPDDSDTVSVKLASKEPSIGEPVFNIAAPLGLFAKEMVPIFHGFYSGDNYSPITDSVVSVYTVPIKNGSSGSPILNSSGELIGVVFSGLEEFETVCFSAKFRELKKFLEE